MVLLICLFWVLCGFFCYGFLNDSLYNYGVKNHRVTAGILCLFGPFALPATLEVLLREDVKFRL
jgi:hypothetical protein